MPAELQPPPPLLWRSWPVWENGWRSVLVIAGLLAAALVVRLATSQTHLAIAALAVLLIALWRYFVPVTFELSGDGVTQSVLGRKRRIPWRAIGHHETADAGVLLLPEEDPSLMAPLRGLYVPWGSHRDEVLRHIDYYLGKTVR